MSGRHAASRPARRVPWVPVAAALVGALGLLGGLGTQAFWNDMASVSGTTVTSGTLDLKVGEQDSYTWSALSIGDIAPGESTAESLTVSNAGSTPFTVSITGSSVTANETLRSALQVTVRTGSTATTTSATYPRVEGCSTTGSITFGPATLPAASTTVLGPSAAIPAGGSLTFCVLIAFSSSADNTLQSKTYQPSFVVTATQVAP